MTERSPSWLILVRHALPRAASAAAVVVGCLVLIGWVFDLGFLKSVAPGLPTMKPTAALAFILAGISLWLLQTERAGRRQRRVATLCSLAVVMVGVLTLVEYVLEWQFGIEPRLTSVVTGAPQPVRMAPATGFGLLIVGSALLVWGRPLGFWFSRSLGLLVAVLGSVGIVGLLVGGRSLSGAGPYATMAPHTAVTLLGLSVGLLGLRRRGPAPVRSRRPELVPALRPSLLVGAGLALTITAVVAIGYLAYLQAQGILRAEYSVRLGTLAVERQQSLALIIREQLAALKALAHGSSIRDLARRLGSAERAPDRAALSGVQENTSFQGLLLVAAPGDARHVASGSFEGNSMGRWAADVAAALTGPSVRFETEDDGEVVLLLGIPVEAPAPASRPLGVLLAGGDLSPIKELFASRVGLGSTGESFLADRRGHPLVSLRYPHQGPGGGSPYEIEATPMKRCLEGESSPLTIMPDYANALTVMAYRSLPEIGGGCLMVHVRADEVFASTGRLQSKLFSLIGLALFVVVGSVLFVGTRVFHGVYRERLRQRMAARREADNLQRLQLAVSQILGEADTVEQGAPKLVAVLGEGMAWHLGTFWSLEASSNTLRCLTMWPTPSVPVDQSVTLNPTIAGSVDSWRFGARESWAPTWVSDLDAQRPIASVTVPPGMRCRMRVPVSIGGNLLAVMEFFSREPRPQRGHWLQIMRDVGIKVGQFLQRKQAEGALAQRARQQAVVAAFGQYALAASDLDQLLHDAVSRIARILDVEYCKVLELLPDGHSLLLRAGVGWKKGAVGHATVGAGTNSQAGFTLISHEPVIVEDLRTETRFTGPPLLHEHGVVSGLSVVIPGQDRPFGVFGAHSASRRTFTQDDVHFFQSMANVLGVAVERQGAEKALRDSETRFRSITQSANEAIISADSGGHILSWNRGAQALFGYEEAEVLGQPLALLMPDRYRDAHRNGLERVRATGESRVIGTTVELHGLRRDRSEFPLELSLASWRSDEEVFFSGIIRDLTERKTLEEQLRQAQKMEAVGRLAGGIAHDFNNMLTVITGYSKLLLDQRKADDPARRSIEQIQKAADRASSLTRQLLAFSRKHVLAPQVLDLNGLVAGLKEMLQRLLGEDINLVASLDPSAGCVNADPGQLEQVIMNLIVNAHDAMPQGGKLIIETAAVEIKASFEHGQVIKPGRYVMLAVSDTGRGMDEETQAHIFEPFFTTKEPSKGTGLGLATVYGIVKQSDGYIMVYSEPGHGAMFKIYLPKIDATPTAESAETSTGLPRGTETILLVEDEPGVRELVRDTLRLHGYTVLEARHGIEALMISHQRPGPIHLLLTDVVMPQMSGREVADRLTRMRPGMRVLYLSGYTDEAVLRHGVLEEEVAFLQKPFPPEALARKVREVLGERLRGRLMRNSA